jgi:putative oxidoreductase
MYVIRGILALAGRLLIVAIFALSAVGSDIPEFDKTVGVMKLHKVPFPEWLLPIAIVFLIVGSISVFVGFKARFGALLLLIFLGLASYFFHNFWDITDQEIQKMQMIEFMKNLSLMGTMLFIIAVGAGPFSVDAHSTDTTG